MGVAPLYGTWSRLAPVVCARYSETTWYIDPWPGLPKVSGRLDEVSVRLGDRVRRGQTLAKVEDREIAEQVKQAQAAFDVSAATICQREADLRLAQTNLDRSKNLFDRQLIPKQTYDDTDARYQAAAAQLDLARAQYQQAQARLDEMEVLVAHQPGHDHVAIAGQPLRHVLAGARRAWQGHHRLRA